MAGRTLYFTKKDGKVEWRTPLDSVLSVLSNGAYKVSIEKNRPPRSISQNALMWMWFSCIEDETGTPKEDIYTFYLSLYSTHLVTIADRTERAVKTSSQMTTEEMGRFLDRVQTHALMELGITLPNPDDRHFGAFLDVYGKK